MFPRVECLTLPLTTRTPNLVSANLIASSMTTLRTLLVLALASSASCFSLQQPALVRGAAAAPLRPARSLRMQEEAPKEAAPTPVDFTPAPPAEAIPAPPPTA